MGDIYQNTAPINISETDILESYADNLGNWASALIQDTADCKVPVSDLELFSQSLFYFPLLRVDYPDYLEGNPVFNEDTASYLIIKSHLATVKVNAKDNLGFLEINSIANLYAQYLLAHLTDYYYVYSEPVREMHNPLSEIQAEELKDIFFSNYIERDGFNLTPTSYQFWYFENIIQTAIPNIIEAHRIQTFIKEHTFPIRK